MNEIESSCNEIVRKKYIYIKDIVQQTMADGPGFRISLYCSGCYHRCKGCHNPETWDMFAGKKTDIDDLLEIILNDKWSDVTFTGGDPLYQVDAFTELARKIKEQSHKNIWVYTGFLAEDIVNDEKLSQILPYIDTIVDGPYIESKRDLSLKFRGSRNQRVLNVENGKIIGLLYNENGRAIKKDLN